MVDKLKKVNLVFFIAIIIIVLINLILHFVYKDEKVSSNDIETATEKLSVIVDAGHGGVDTGAPNAFGEDEASINIKIANYLVDFLMIAGYEVEMTRYDENALYVEEIGKTIREKKNEDLDNRVELINSSNADLVISIHLNTFSQSKYYGAQTFYKKNCEESKLAAETIQKFFLEILDENNERIPQSKEAVRIIDDSQVPIVLAECGFLTNPSESVMLGSPLYQEKVAWAIFKGITEYFAIENKTDELSLLNDN